eukprot:m.54145 g.54145  ORF g.54145 m.54145 type:complete len:306 (+) comp48697_c0_seq1:733-1650(+)
MGSFDLGFLTHGFLSFVGESSDSEAIGDSFAAALCSNPTRECIMSASVSEILAAQHKTSAEFARFPFGSLPVFLPTVDGTLLPGQFLHQFETGAFNAVPTIIGSTEDEIRMFFWQRYSTPWNKEIYEDFVKANFYGSQHAILQQYPGATNESDYREVGNDLSNDYVFYCAERSLALHLVKANPNVYRYSFTRSLAWSGWWDFLNAPFCAGRACHAVELPFVFASVPVLLPEELTLSKTLMSYWGNFAYNGNPNGVGQGESVLPAWPALSQSPGLELQILDVPASHPDTDRRARLCELWDRLGYQF